MAAALDAMPEKRPITDSLQKDGDVCALGAVGKVRGIEMSKIDPEDRDAVADAFDIAPALAQEIAYQNDEYLGEDQTPEQLWKSMRKWVGSQIKP
jgi:hypothetical protein